MRYPSNIHCSFEERQLAQKNYQKLPTEHWPSRCFWGEEKTSFKHPIVLVQQVVFGAPPSKAYSRRWQQASQEAPAAAAATAKGQRIQISWQKKFQRQWLDFNDHLGIGTGGSCAVVPKNIWFSGLKCLLPLFSTKIGVKLSPHTGISWFMPTRNPPTVSGGKSSRRASEKASWRSHQKAFPLP